MGFAHDRAHLLPHEISEASRLAEFLLGESINSSMLIEPPRSETDGNRIASVIQLS